MGALRMLVARFPDWAVVAAACPQAVPVVVVGANQVVAASPAARADGVRTGMRRRQAQSLCPAVETVADDPARDARAWSPVVSALDVLCPAVEVGQPGMVAFATRGPSRYFGGDDALAGKVSAALEAAIGRPGARVGVADGRLAARLAARMGGPAAPLRVVAVGGSREFLAPWPVGILGGPVLGRPELADICERLGLRTLGAVAALAPGTMTARFGPDGAAAHRLCRGLDEHPLSVRRPPPDLVVETELDPPAERVDTVAFAGKALADELHARLEQGGLACVRVAIEASTEHGEHLVRRWRHDGALDAGAIAQRVRWQLEGWLGSGTTAAGVTRLRLVPEEVRPDRGRQLGLWGGSAATDERASAGLARLQGLLGPEAVTTAMVVGGRDPRWQCRRVPWGEPRDPPPATTTPAPPGTRAPGTRAPGTRAPGSDGVAPWPGSLPGPAPAVVHPGPLPAEVHDAAGHPLAVTGRGTLGGVPASLSVAGGAWAAVSAWAGPWPVEEQWWDPPGRRRARFQIVAGGVAHLVVRETGRWWVDATYD